MGELTVDLTAELSARRVMAIVRGSDPEASVRCLEVLAEEGVTLAEVSLTGADAVGVIGRARRRLGPDVALGAGTVVHPDQARAALDAGATFLVSPALTEGIAAAASEGVAVLPGAFTPTEVLAAHQLCGGPVKLFPASLGGPGYLRGLSGPYPDVPLVAVGGVGAADAVEFLRAGALAVGVGGPLLGDAADGGDLDGLRRRARSLVEAVGQAGARL